MDILHAVILGIIEGVTEFLPISSTGHLILASNLLHIPQTEFLKTFEIAIQLGAIFAVVALYFKKFFDWEIIKKLFVAFLPTAIIGLAFYNLVKTYLMGNELVVLFALLLGGIALIAFESWHTENETGATEIKDITYKQAALIGLFQAIAIIPGVSRSASTILGGLFLGLKRITIVEFSFLLAVPTMAAATGLDVIKNVNLFTPDTLITLSIGFIVSFIVALLSIKFLLAFIRKHSFTPFGIYRIVVAILFLLLIIQL
jgi:undecaprenyl-diphosphatase